MSRPLALRLKVLGGVSLEGINGPVDLESRRHQALLIYLAVTAAPQPRDKLTGLLWGEWPEARARRYLSRALWDIGKHIPTQPPILLADASTVTFNRQSAYWLDVEVFERLATPQSDIETLKTAVTFYEGDFLDGFFLHDCPEFELWLLAQRTRLHDVATEALTRLVAHYIAQGPEGYTNGITYARQLLNLDPWREETHRQLMVLLALSGQRSAALAQFKHCRRLLHDELGLEPGEETVALYHRICSTPSPALVPTSESDELPLVFAGRSAEHTVLLRDWQATRQRKGKFTLLEGEAGIGKTRLAEEVLRYVENLGTLVLRGRCHDFQGPLAYQPLTAALRSALPHIQSRLDRLDNVWLMELSRLLPELRTLKPDLPEAKGDSETAIRQRLFEAIAQLLTSLSAPVVFLDDLHRADPATIDLLRYLLYRLADAPIWFIGAYRHEELPDTHPLLLLQHDLGREGRVNLITLAPLSQDKIVDMLRGFSGLTLPQAEALAAYLNHTTQGNPLIIREHLRDLIQHGWLVKQGERWVLREEQLAPGAAVHETHVPAQVQSMVLGRIQRLPAQARHLLEQLSVTGEPFEQRLLTELGTIMSLDAHEALNLLLSHALVRMVPERPTIRYEFAHPLFREIIYHHLPPERRRLYHGHMARALERLYQGQEQAMVAQLAYHYTQSKEADKALTYLLQTGEHLQATSALKAAIEAYTLALTLIPPEDRATRYHVLAQRERLYNQTAQRDAQAADLTAMESLATDDMQRADVLTRRAEWAMRKGNFLDCIAAAQQARALAGPDSLITAKSLRLEAIGHLRLDHLQEALALCRQSVDLCRRCGNCKEESFSLGTLGICELSLGHLEQAREAMETVLAFWEEQGNPWRIAIASNNLSMLYHRMGDYGKALRVQAQARALMPQTGDLDLEAHLLTSIGVVYHTLGRYEEALMSYKEAVKLARLIADRSIEAFALMRWGETLLAMEEVEQAEHMFHTAQHLKEEHHLPGRQAELLLGLARCAITRGDFAQALHLLDTAETIEKESGAANVDAIAILKAEVYILQGEHAAGRHALLTLQAMGGPEALQTLDPETLWKLSQLWQALGERDAAHQALHAAHTELQRHAASLDEASDRERYLTGIPAHRAIVKAIEEQTGEHGEL